MPVIRVEKNKNYTTMSNYHLRDKNLTLKAKGLLSMCLSLPEGWDYSINGLAEICKEGRDGIKNTLNELKENGYLIRETLRDEQGHFIGNEYVIYENPQKKGSDPSGEEAGDAGSPDVDKPDAENPDADKPDAGKPYTEKPHAGKPYTGEPDTENPTELSKEELSTEESNTEQINKRGNKESRHKYGRYGNVLLSDSEMDSLKAEFPSDWRQRIERLSEYMASTGKSYKNHLATIRSWARRDSQKSPKYSHDKYRYREGESL